MTLPSDDVYTAAGFAVVVAADGADVFETPSETGFTVVSGDGAELPVHPAKTAEIMRSAVTMLMRNMCFLLKLIVFQSFVVQ
jgi:hypothetical protein